MAVAAGQSVSGIDAQLDLTGFVSGTVTDENGEPISNIFIDFYSLDADGFPSGEGFGGTTNDLGRFHVPFVAPGDYVVGFTDLSGNYVNEYYDDHLSIFDGELVHVSAGADTTGIDAELAFGGHLAGTVTDSEGNGLGDIRLELGILLDGDWASFGEEYTYITNEDGTYQIDGLPTGTYRVEFNDPSRTYLSEQYDDQLPNDEGTPVTVTAPETTEPHRRLPGQGRAGHGHGHRRGRRADRGHLRVPPRPGGRQLVLLRRRGDGRRRHLHDGRPAPRDELPGLVRVAG